MTVRLQPGRLIALIGVPLIAMSLAGAAPWAIADPRPGDGHRFDTWTGYEIGRFSKAAVAADFNEDGSPDVAYARRDFFRPSMSVQLNLGDGTMSRYTRYESQIYSNDIAAGDLDGDGHVDLVAVAEGTSFNNTKIDLYFGDGTGRFLRASARGGIGPAHLVLADLDADGDPDIAMTNYRFGSGGSDVSVLLNRGDGTFSLETRYPVGENPHGIAAADFDGDGDPDLAITRFESTGTGPRLVFMLNDGAGAFSGGPTSKYTGGTGAVTAGDWNGDGRADLAIAGTGTDRHLILTNQGGLQFTSSAYTAGFSSYDLLAADLDGDGDQDIVSATGGSSSTGDLSLLRNRGGGTFRVSRFESGDQPQGLDAADFDADGRLDLAIATAGSPTGIIDLQRPNGSFDSTPLYPTPFPATAVTNSDFDHDGDQDVASTSDDISSGSSDTIQVFENDGSGRLEPVTSIQGGLTGFGGIGDVAAGDLNGDGWADLIWGFNQLGSPGSAYVVSLNQGGGVFGPIQATPIGSLAVGTIELTDMDGDGDPDMVSSFGARVAIWLNDGDAHFAPPRFVPVGDDSLTVIAPDLNADGIPDLAVTHPGVYGSSAEVSVVLGLGGLRFGPFRLYSVGQGPEDIAAADLSGDGKPELVTSNIGTENGPARREVVIQSESMTVMRNDGSGRFPAVRTYPGEDISGYLASTAVDAADMDEDGFADVVVGNALGNDANVYYGHGDGTVEARPLRYGMHTLLEDLLVADMNGDGALDVVATASIGGSLSSPFGVTVMLNRG